MDHDPTTFPTQRPLEKHTRIEADLFCDQCGYNLHSQRVERDERLGILVVRCTECGRFQPAAVASNVQRVWLSRFSSILIALWCLFLVAGIGLSGLALAGIQVGYVESTTRGDWVSPDRVAAYRQWDAQKQAMVWYSADTQQPLQGPAPEWRRVWIPMDEILYDKLAVSIALFFMNLAPFVLGVLLATFLWHVPRRRYWLALMIPLLAALVMGMILYVNEGHRGEGTADLAPMYIVQFAAMVSQMVMVFLGLLAGRPIARFLATLFVPPRARQAIGFLWTIDGKQPPRAAPIPDPHRSNTG